LSFEITFPATLVIGQTPIVIESH